MDEKTKQAIDAQKTLTMAVELIVAVFGTKRAVSMLRTAASMLKDASK